LGGHSLMAVRLANRVQQAGWQLPLQALFASPVLHVLAQALQVAPTQESIVAPPRLRCAKRCRLAAAAADRRCSSSRPALAITLMYLNWPRRSMKASRSTLCRGRRWRRSRRP
ncbi:acyl carrier protein, partial [Serratia ureilytica]|nr:acyl carrier protein [Serratia ureilytica]